MFRSARQALSLRRHRWVGFTLCAALALLGVSAVIFLTGGSAGTHTGTSSGTRTTKATGTSTGVPGPVAAATHASRAATPKQAHNARVAVHANTAAVLPQGVAAWDAGYGGAAQAAVSKQLGNVLMSYGFHQLPSMKQACGMLTAAVTRAAANAPIPDAAMQMSYQRALAELAKGAADCQAGISTRLQGVEDVVVHEDAPAVNQAMSVLAAGAKDLYQATAKIESTNRR